MLVQKKFYQIEAEQIGSTADSATYRMRASILNNGRWGTKGNIAIYDHNGRVVYWNAPELSKWTWRDGGYYIWESYYNSGWIQLNWYYYNDQPGYALESVYEHTATVTGISRGNNRQGSKTINIGIKSTFTDSDFPNCIGDLTVYTSKIADVSNVRLSVSIDDVTETDRKIHVNVSFTNPESYYTGYIYHNGSQIGTVTSSNTIDIPVTYAMFNTTQKFSISIKGKDGQEYYSTNSSILVQPSGVGIWYKNNNKMNEVYHVYFKNNNGEMIDVTEAWAKLGGKIIKTVK